VADYGSSAATLLANDGTALSPSQGSSVGSGGFIGGSKLPFPEAVAVDAQNNAWFGAQNFLVKVTPSGKFTPYSCGSSALGVALDPNGNIWVADGSAHSVVEVAATGTILQTLNGEGGIFGTQGITVDGSGNVWASNYHGSTISEFSPGPSSVALSPSYGFGLDANLNLPIGISPDASGNLWVANSFLDSIVEFVGLAAPVATPRLGLPAKP
jgi:streptogramin lyase